MKSVDAQNYTELMHAAQNGDKTAYETLLKKLAPLVLRVILKKISNLESAQDIQQNVLLTLHRARHTYDPSRAFGPWFFSIVRNKIYDHLRKQRRIRLWETVSLDLIDFQEAELDTHIQEQEILNKALAKLNANEKQAVELLKIKGLSQKDAAKHLNISLSALKVRAHRGYLHLKQIIEEGDF